MAVTDDPDTRLALGRLAPLLGFHLRMASAAIARDFATELSDLDLTQKQYAVLELVAANVAVSQVDLARTLGTDRATMMALVDRLDARGLLVRQPSPSDRRRQDLLLTAAGSALLADARRRIARHERRFKARLGNADTQRLMQLLQRLTA
jgi:DNA-binding MarR family transcriptional regulator